MIKNPDFSDYSRNTESRLPSSIPNSIGRYTVESILGRGGMGLVYKAYDPSMQRHVAIKALRLQRDEEAREALPKLSKWEAQLGGKLLHTNVVAVYDLLVEDELPYIVMELVNGTPMDEYAIVNAPLCLGSIVNVFSQACEALHYIHERGILHKDVKPTNMLIEDGEKVKILDFGLSDTVAQSDSPAALDGVFAGTWAYASPEATNGGKLDRRTDIYSLGVILHEILMGGLPDRPKEQYAISYRGLKAIKEPPYYVFEDVSKAFSHILTKALSSNKDARYDSMKAFQHDLENYASLQYVLEQDSGKAPALNGTSGDRDPASQCILLVEPDAELQDRLRVVFTSMGYCLQITKTLKEAQQVLKNPAGISALLAESSLSDGNGMDLCRSLRANQETASLPFIFFTESKDPMVRVQGFNVGANDYVLKPFHAKEVVLKVQKVLRKYRRTA